MTGVRYRYVRSIRHRLRLLGALISVACAGAGQLAGAVPARAQSGAGVSPAASALQRTLARDLRRIGGAGSALVVDETTGQTLFASAPDVRRLPASVEKLYTTTTALLRFGPRAQFATRIYGVGQLGPNGIWDGTLYLRGGGDPTFGDAAFDQAAYGTGATVQALAANLLHAGIRGVTGPVIGDESYFDSLRGTSATHYRPDLEYEGELSALSFDAGFTSNTEAALQQRPAQFAAQALVAALHARRFRFPKGSPTYTGPAPYGATLLATVESPPLSTLIELTNSPSDNFFAETLLKDLGARFGGAGTTGAGAAVVRATLAQRFGLAPQLNDGSGLSRSDQTTASQVVTLLRRMAGDADFTASLAIAGVRGTMEHEMVGTRAVDNCRGKTGTLRDAANLTGYCTARNGDELTFAFLVSRQRQTDYVHLIEDRMAVALANYSP